jgi:hypothetical protein
MVMESLPPTFKLASCSAYSSILKMEAVCSLETSADFQRTKRRYMPEDAIVTLLGNESENKPAIHARNNRTGVASGGSHISIASKHVPTNTQPEDVHYWVTDVLCAVVRP